jgi:hypothetical protein
VDYAAASARPTPDAWKAGSVWSFTVERLHGKQESWTFRVSDAPAKTCASGDWQKLDLLAGNLGTLGEAAYLVRGQFLFVQLASNLCDASNNFRGELVGSSFMGNYPTHSQGWNYVARVRGNLVDGTTSNNSFKVTPEGAPQLNR